MDLTKIKHLKFTTSAVGVEDLKTKGWAVLDTFAPLDGQTYYLLGLPSDERDARIAELEAQLAGLRNRLD